jgi:hypothetical protein
VLATRESLSKISCGLIKDEEFKKLDGLDKVLINLGLFVLSCGVFVASLSGSSA